MMHTPGPWEARSVTVHDMTGLKVADCRNYALPFEELPSNAALIAAAPDMLEALNNVIFMWRNLIPMYKGQAEYHEAIAAVRKARGES